MTTAQSGGGRTRGLIYILSATAVAGVVGYVIQLLAPAMLAGPADYLAFSVFWSALHFVVAAIAGVQQEVTRAAHPVTRAAHSTERSGNPGVLQQFAVRAGCALIVLTVISGIFLADILFPQSPFWMTLWLGIGLLGNLLLAILAGVLYGLSFWPAIAALTVTDALIRGVLVSIGLVLQLEPATLAAFIALPFSLAFGTIWLAARKQVAGRYRLDVDARRLSLNTLSTVAASAGAGVMVAGLPLFIKLAMPLTPADMLASLILIITVTRAPLIIPLMALQSFLILEFRTAGAASSRRLVQYLLGVAGITVVASLAAFAWGPWLANFISAGRYQVDPLTAALVVASAGLVGLMCLTGPALLSRNRHKLYASGWVAAALATIALLFVPIHPEQRTLLALIIAPCLGLIVHATGMRRRVIAYD